MEQFWNGAQSFVAPGAPVDVVRKADLDELEDGLEGFVIEKISALSANYVAFSAANEPFPTKSALTNAAGFFHAGADYIPSDKDWCVVLADEDYAGAETRYTLSGGVWCFQYKVNNTPFTPEQIAALNSGITAAIVAGITNRIAQIGAIYQTQAADETTAAQMAAKYGGTWELFETRVTIMQNLSIRPFTLTGTLPWGLDISVATPNFYLYAGMELKKAGNSANYALPPLTCATLLRGNTSAYTIKANSGLNMIGTSSTLIAPGYTATPAGGNLNTGITGLMATTDSSRIWVQWKWNDGKPYLQFRNLIGEDVTVAINSSISTASAADVQLQMNDAAIIRDISANPRKTYVFVRLS